MRRRGALILCILAAAAVIAGSAAGALGLISGAATAGIRASLAIAPGTDLSLRIALPLADDRTAQDDAVSALIRERFRSDRGAIPIDIVRTIVSDQGVASAAGGTDVPTPVLVASMANLPRYAALDVGAWPTDAAGATMQVDAARDAGLAVGDAIDVGGARLVLTGTWHIVDADDPAIMGEAVWLSGARGDVRGPLVIDPSEWSRVAPDHAHAQWTIVPVLDRLDALDLSAIDRAWGGVDSALAAIGERSADTSGQFVRTADQITDRLSALRTATPLVLTTLAAIGALALWELVGLVARSRAAETALLSARGAGAALLSASSAAEAGLLSAVGAAAGLGGAVVATKLAASPGAVGAAVSAGVWLVPVIGLVVATMAWLRARPAAFGAGRTTRFAGAGAVLLISAMAALSTWQLLEHGAVTATVSGRVGVDPVAVLAPSLLLLAVVSACALGLPLLLRAIDVGAERRGGDGLVARAVARRVGATAVTVVAVGLALGQVLSSAGYVATWHTSYAQMQQLHAGSALRIVATELSDDALTVASATPGIRGVAPVETRTVALGASAVQFVGVAPDAMRSIGVGAGAVEPAALADDIGLTDTAALPAGSTRFEVTFGGPAPARAGAWLMDGWGMLHRLDLTVGEDGLATGAVPRTAHFPWRAIAVEAVPAVSAAAGAVTRVELEGIATDRGEVSMPFAWNASQFERDRRLDTQVVKEPSATVLGDEDVLVRFVAVAPAPIVLASAAARDADLTQGDVATIDFAGAVRPVSARISAIAVAVPGSAGSFAALGDIATLVSYDLADQRTPSGPSTAWVAAADPVRAADALRAALPPGASVRSTADDPDSAMLSATATALWIATSGCILLAATCLAAACGAQLRDRRDELGVLRALGLTPGRQGAMRRAEQWTAVALGAAAGSLAAVLVVLVSVPALARAGIPYPFLDVLTVARWDPAPAAAAAAALALLAAAAIGVYGQVVSRRAASATPGADR